MQGIKNQVTTTPQQAREIDLSPAPHVKVGGKAIPAKHNPSSPHFLALPVHFHCLLFCPLKIWIRQLLFPCVPGTSLEGQNSSLLLATATSLWQSQQLNIPYKVLLKPPLGCLICCCCSSWALHCKILLMWISRHKNTNLFLGKLYYFRYDVDLFPQWV